MQNSVVSVANVMSLLEEQLLEFTTMLTDSANKNIVVLGSGPIRIGQGIEFDYASVQSVQSLKKLGYKVAIINNNPETSALEAAARITYPVLMRPSYVLGGQNMIIA